MAHVYEFLLKHLLAESCFQLHLLIQLSSLAVYVVLSNISNFIIDKTIKVKAKPWRNIPDSFFETRPSPLLNLDTSVKSLFANGKSMPDVLSTPASVIRTLFITKPTHVANTQCIEPISYA